MLPQTESVIYLDTDTLLLDDIGHLWELLHRLERKEKIALYIIKGKSRFDGVQLGGLAPVESHYANTRDLPLPGPPGLGLNAGVILYNLTRLRQLPGGGFTEAVRFVRERWGDRLRLADQDILNVFFGISPRYEQTHKYKVSCMISNSVMVHSR